MISAPKISVIMPVYGRTEFLSRAIDSVFEQTYSNIEFIIVDDNDPDTEYRAQTKGIVDEHKSRGRNILYLQHDRNRNGAAARNTGFRYSTGELISFLDADDAYLPTRLQDLYQIIDGCAENVVGVYSGVEFRRKGKTFAIYTKARAGNFLVETLACKFMLGTGSNIFLKRWVIEELGGFDEAFWRHQDFEFMARLFGKYDLAATNAVLVVKNNENYNLPRFSRSLEIKVQYLDKFKSIIQQLPGNDRDYILFANYSWLGELALKNGLRQESKQMYGVARRHGNSSLTGRMRRVVLWVMSWFEN